MVFVSENEKTGTFSHLWMLTAIYVCFMVFVSENEKTGTFSHLWMSTAIYVCFMSLGEPNLRN